MSGSVLLAGGLVALGLAITMAVVAMLPARSGLHGVAGALAAIEHRYAQHDPAAAAQAADPFAALPGWVRGLAARLSPSGIAGTLQRRLDLAGNPARWTPDRMLGVKGLGLLVLGGLGGLFGLPSLGLTVLCAAIGGAAGFFVPDVLLYNAGVKRQARIQALLPDALDMLTVCVEAGLGFDAALGQVARNTRGPLASEFARALQEMQIGASRSHALRAMVARTTVPELRSFVSALVQAGELGIAVATVLREQAKEMRLRRRQRAEEKAQKVPIKILFPLIFCLFPALFVVVLGPGIISIAHTLLGR
jgi:tight adherence protein C